MPWKNSHVKKLSHIKDEIIKLFRSQPKIVFLTQHVRSNIESDISHTTLSRYLNELAEDNKIKKILSGGKSLWLKK